VSDVHVVFMKYEMRSVVIVLFFFSSDIFKQSPLIGSGELPPYKETRIPGMKWEPFGRLFFFFFQTVSNR